MPASIPPQAKRGRFRTIFVSDVHLGCRYSQAENFLQFLESVHPEGLYLVGDFIDGWRLKRRWHWQAVYIKIFQRLMKLAAQGTRIYYTPGNHDEFLRDYLHDFGFVTVADQFVHKTADNRRLIVLHGDQFDRIEGHARWLSMAGAFAYDALVAMNSRVNRLRSYFRLDEFRFSARVKVWAKRAVQFISDFEERLVCHAKDRECHGVVCGHIHVPRLDHFGDVVYCNTGDWVEHRSALVEHHTGELELISWTGANTETLFSDQRWQLSGGNRSSVPEFASV
jgi:UDP-2,3-diacylglucosamine pyrophosphatase LpxH